MGNEVLKGEKRIDMEKPTLNRIMQRYEEMVNSEYDFPSFAAYYVTDNDCNGSTEKPFKVKSLCLYCLNPFQPNKNGKYEFSKEQKLDLKEKILNTFNKENMYMF